jgi:hypothetical protein
MDIKKHVYNFINNGLTEDINPTVRKHIYNFVNKKKIREGLYLSKNGNSIRPDLKYYAFDWDDNLMFMPTKIILLSKNDEEVPMSTEDFAEYRHQIGVEEFNYKGTTIIGFAPDSFRYFGEEGDKGFIIDVMTAPVGPAWNDFIECINGGSIFAIITARGHNPNTLKEGIYNLITKNHNGINKETLIQNLQKYHTIVSDVNEDIGDDLSKPKYEGSDLIDDYLDRCLMAPVTFRSGAATKPEEGKKAALRKFISYCRDLSKVLIDSIMKKEKDVSLAELSPKFKNDIANNEITQSIDEFITQNMRLGFSDDDERNVISIDDMLSTEYPENPVTLYLTKGGEKKRFK